MSLLSRRQFLHVAGITLLNNRFHFNQLWPQHQLQAPTALYGRTLTPTSVWATPHEGSRLVSTLWPDSIVEIKAETSGWYQLSNGFVSRSAVQPILLHPVEPDITSVPFWGEVASPVAPVRQWAAVDAPLVTRIGHGGVAKVTDYLPSAGERGWYALASYENELLGWTQAVHWQRIEFISAESPASLRVEINQAQRMLTLYQHHHPVFQASVSINTHLPAGNFPLKQEKPHLSPFALSGTNTVIYAAPWHMKIGDHYDLCGVYWHNDFSQAASGPHIQITSLAARWLYHSLSDNVSVTIV